MLRLSEPDGLRAEVSEGLPARAVIDEVQEERPAPATRDGVDYVVGIYVVGGSVRSESEGVPKEVLGMVDGEVPSVRRCVVA